MFSWGGTKVLEYVRVEHLKIGDICAKNLYDDDGHVICEGDMTLSAHAIKSIREFGYKGIYILHPGNNRRELVPLLEPLFDDVLLMKLFKTVQSLFVNHEVIYDPFDSQFMEDKKVVHELADQMIEILIQADKDNRLLFEVEDQRTFNTWIYFHTVTVCILSIGIAIKMGLSRKEITDVALAAIYHDVGKARVDAKVVNNREITETEREILRNHPENMFLFLKKHGYSMNTLFGVRQHHEKIDGTGYPLGLKGNLINVAARIISCADAYDHLVNKDPYKAKSMYAAEAIEYMSANQEYDLECLKALFQIIAPYTVGTKVLLSNGVEALVVKNSTLQPLRPIVLIDKQMVKLDSDSDYLSVTITGVAK